ncbi:MAG: histone deacetylase [Acidobacteria bacterium]|nr:histone deacetylase [Acidobacteriota bacterium]
MGNVPFHFSYHPSYNLRLGDHVFPSVKFERIREELEKRGLLSEANLLKPVQATREQVMLVHSPDWVAALMDGTIRYDQVMRLEIPYSRPMVEGFLYHTGGSIEAARAALRDGAAFNIGGGFHHAFGGHGEGFCAIHDVAVAVRVLQEEKAIKTAMVIDTDVHQGNGTAGIFAGDHSVFTLSIHQRDNYPYEKQTSDLDIELDDGIGDLEYLSALQAGLEEAFSRMQPALVAYVAGSDPYEQDKLGGLQLTMGGMMERDLLVMRAARSRGIPIFVTLAGGYAVKLEDTVALHTNTALALAATMTA